MTQFNLDQPIVSVTRPTRATLTNVEPISARELHQGIVSGDLKGLKVKNGHTVATGTQTYREHGGVKTDLFLAITGHGYGKPNKPRTELTRTGNVLLDIDRPNGVSREQIAAWGPTILVADSCSKGLWALVATDDNHPQFSEVVSQVQDAFVSEFGDIIDRSNKQDDLARLRFVAHDKEAILSEAVTPLLVDSSVEHQYMLPIADRTEDPNDRFVASDLIAALNKIDPSTLSLEEWLNLTFSIGAAFIEGKVNGGTNKAWDDWCRRDKSLNESGEPRYNFSENRVTWKRAVDEEVYRERLSKGEKVQTPALICGLMNPEREKRLEEEGKSDLFKWFPLLSEFTFVKEEVDPVLPHLVWPNLSTLLHSEEKQGKSTLLGAGIAAITTGGTFLGEPVEKGRVLIVYEEATQFLYERIEERGGDLTMIRGAQRWVEPGEKVEAVDRLCEMIEVYSPRLVVVDTLTHLNQVKSRSYDANTVSAGEPIQRLREACEQTGIGTGILFVHHDRKNNEGGNKYRDSTSIGASPDMLIGMTANKNTRVQTLRYTGRKQELDNTQLEIVMSKDGLHSLADEYEIEAGILRVVRQHRDGVNRATIEKEVGRRASKVREKLKELVDRKTLVHANDLYYPD